MILLIKTKNRDGVKHVMLLDAEVQLEQTGDGIYGDIIPHDVLLDGLILHHFAGSLDLDHLLLEDQRIPFQPSSHLCLHVPQRRT